MAGKQHLRLVRADGTTIDDRLAEDPEDQFWYDLATAATQALMNLSPEHPSFGDLRDYVVDLRLGAGLACWPGYASARELSGPAHR